MSDRKSRYPRVSHYLGPQVPWRLVPVSSPGVPAEAAVPKAGAAAGAPGERGGLWSGWHAGRAARGAA